MKPSFKILLVCLCSFNAQSCNHGEETDYIKNLKSVYDLNYPKDFKVTWAESHSGMGDYDDSFELTFSPNSFRKIAAQIDTLKLGKVINTPGAFFVHQQIKGSEFKEVTFYFKKNTVVYTHAAL